MKNLFTSALLLLSTFTVLVWSATIPNADTPLFYLVASSPSSVNLLPLRMTSGGGGGLASFLGSGTPALFYFWQGQLTAIDPSGSTYRPLIDSHQDANGCQNFGALAFVQGGSTNKCASYSSFQLQSNNQDSQLGAQLVFNYVGGFYACSSGQEVWYKINESDGPSGCQPVNLYTVPAY
ncbi:hypothetical protein GALMADRAFT_213838 [Galerina marginata CBS 339.88]|uniref:Ubiquitin 3 binding protein But2 C-terminal domain-containing protein n=1 Tax=Galerina marginata (strain CBS 339.88) TaxID=685588 RepID=A0A067SV37_GALM3|nr:hypothetical protein GALMADRAFT_213838 [Galerina marginata CBS 339.88]